MNVKRVTLSTLEESIREFFVRRPFLYGDDPELPIRAHEYASLKARDGKFWTKLPKYRQLYLLGFISGWKHSR